MRLISAAELRRAVSYEQAIGALEDAFRVEDPARVPAREGYAVPAGELLTMPAFGAAGVGVKLVTINPTNPDRGLPLIGGVYVLFDPTTSEPLAVIDGAALTGLRTASVSALASRYLARPGSSRLVVFGSGTQAAAHIDALATVLALEHVAIVGRTAANVDALVERVREQGIAADRATTAALARADVVCTTTTSAEPLFAAAALAPGTHVNAVGSYRPDRTELPLELLRGSLVVVETVAAALAEAGELAQAIDAGLFTAAEIGGELADVVAERVVRAGDDQISIFKSVGLALEDLAVAGAAARALV